MKILHIPSARGGQAYWDEDGNLRVKSSLSGPWWRQLRMRSPRWSRRGTGCRWGG